MASRQGLRSQGVLKKPQVLDSQGKKNSLLQRPWRLVVVPHGLSAFAPVATSRLSAGDFLGSGSWGVTDLPLLLKALGSILISAICLLGL